MTTKEVMLETIRVEIDGFRLRSIVIPDGYVSLAFNAHVDNHIVIPGDQLKEGMIVIAFDKLFRDNPERLEPEYLIRNPNFRLTSQDRLSVSEQARWSIVTNLRTVGNLVKWTSLYGDGTMIARQYNKSIEWIVLKDFEATVFCDNCEGYHNLAETLQDQQIATEAGFITEDGEPSEAYQQMLNYLKFDAKTTQFATAKEYLESRNEQSSRYSKPATTNRWINVNVFELEYGDIFLIGGKDYRILSVRPNDLGEHIIRVEPLDSKGSLAPTMIFPGTFEFRVSRQFSN